MATGSVAEVLLTPDLEDTEAEVVDVCRDFEGVEVLGV